MKVHVDVKISAQLLAFMVSTSGASTWAHEERPLSAPSGAATSEFRLQPYEIHPTGNKGVSVEIGDVTGDGRTDVALTTRDDDHSLYLFAQDENGQLQLPTIRPFGTASDRTGIAVIDLDGVNGLDVVVGTATGLSVFLSSTSGGLDDLEKYSTRPAHYIEALDLNGNGKLDLASTSWSNEGSIHLNQGNGGVISFDWPVPVAGRNSTATGDLDGDGDADMAVASAQGSSFVFLYRNGSSGTLQSVRFLTITCGSGSASAKGVAIGDFNSDGFADVAASSGGNLPNTCLSVFYGQGNYVFSAPEVFATYEIPSLVRAADMDGDGRQDLVVLHEGWRQLGVYLQQSNGTLSNEVLYPLPFENDAHAEALAIGDINSDRCTDVLYANEAGLVTLHGERCDPLHSDGFEN